MFNFYIVLVFKWGEGNIICDELTVFSMDGNNLITFDYHGVKLTDISTEECFQAFNFSGILQENGKYKCYGFGTEVYFKTIET